MNSKKLILIGLGLFLTNLISAQYNNLWIPDTLSGKSFNLVIKDTFSQIVKGQQTITAGINGKFWGPTLIIQKHDTVRMNVLNKLNDTTTLHWHGMHLPAVMDGGPYQLIPPNTTWRPYWKMKNQAGTYWFHPHLHEMTMDQITKGIGGLIIVRDSAEAALKLPRKYGVDDIPLILTDRSFTTANQFKLVPYGDSAMTNGVLRAQFTLPAQMVRFRILNAAIERSFNIGFSDNRDFYIIGSDGGLLSTPTTLKRFLLSAGERVEILVNLTGMTAGQTLDFKAFNSTLANNIPGGENFPNGPFASAIGKKDFNLLHINIINALSANEIKTVPTKLVSNIYPKAADAKVTRYLSMNDSTGLPGILGPNAFIINHKLFKYGFNNYTVPLNNTEIWQIKSTSGFAHPFHIHDVEFNILTINGVAPPAEQAGWKDVILVKPNSTVRFIAKFDDFADASHPFMYHCHISLHEDEGMMGQFLVTDNQSQVQNIPTGTVSIFPNPGNDKLYLNTNFNWSELYYVKITKPNGATAMMLPQPEEGKAIDISNLKPGLYFLSVIQKGFSQPIVVKFVKE